MPNSCLLREGRRGRRRRSRCGPGGRPPAPPGSRRHHPAPASVGRWASEPLAFRKRRPATPHRPSGSDRGRSPVPAAGHTRSSRGERLRTLARVARIGRGIRADHSRRRLFRLRKSERIHGGSMADSCRYAEALLAEHRRGAYRHRRAGPRGKRGAFESPPGPLSPSAPPATGVVDSPDSARGVRKNGGRECSPRRGNEDDSCFW